MGAFSQAEIMAQRLFTRTFPQLSLARYSLQILMELWHFQPIRGKKLRKLTIKVCNILFNEKHRSFIMMQITLLRVHNRIQQVCTAKQCNYDEVCFNHFSMTGRCTGPPRYDVSIRQAGTAAIVTSSFKIFWTQTCPLCGATCYILPSRLFNGVNFGYHSVEVVQTFSSYLRVLVRIRNLYNGGRY